MKNRLLVSMFSVFALSASAANAALADLTAGVSFLDVITAIFAVGALIITVDLAQIGYRHARKMIKGA